MCVDPDWWPFEAIDERGVHVGIAADLVALATSRAKLQVALYPTRTWEESVAASKAGKCQLTSFLNQSPERDQWLIFTEPLLVDPNVLIVREDSAPLGDLVTLKGRSIALPRESAVYERVRKDFPNLKLIGTDSEYEAFGMVSNRKADMTLRSRIVAGQNIKEKGWFNLKIASEVPGYENVLRMGVMKSLPALRDQLNGGIATIARAEREQIINRHVEIKMVTDVQVDYTPVIWLGVVLIAVVATSLVWMRRLKALNRRLQRLSVTDALTGLFNRTGLSASFPLDIERAQRYRRPLSIVLLDLDHFKIVNDEFGHLVGDKVLVEFANLIRATVRQVDAIYRWGGEEFLIICPETPPEQVRNLTERILDGVRRYHFPTRRTMTVSAGVAHLGVGDTMTSLLQRADEALYQAKTTGRDRICLAPDVLSPNAKEPSDQSGVAGLVQLVWRPDYACGNEAIDQQHRALFAHSNVLLAAMLDSKPSADVSASIDVLLAGILEHFADEERVLAAAGFAGLDEHAEKHRRLVERAKELVALFGQGALAFGELFQFLADDVVARHMLVEDSKYHWLIAAKSRIARLPGTRPPDHALGDEVAQRRHEIEREQTQSARDAQRRQVVREQADDAVGEGHAAATVELAATGVGVEGGWIAGVGVLFQSIEQRFGEFPRVAQTKVEALAGNRVQCLCGVADPHLARAHELVSHAQCERVGGARSGMDEIETRAELCAQGGEEPVIVECEDVFRFLRRQGKHHRVVFAERQQRERAIRREALPCAVAVRSYGADFSDNCVLVVVADADVRVVLRCAFGVNDEFGRDLPGDLAARDRDQCTAVVGGYRYDPARLQPLRCRDARVERSREVAVAHDVAQSRCFVVACVDHRSPEPATL